MSILFVMLFVAFIAAGGQKRGQRFLKNIHYYDNH